MGLSKSFIYKIFKVKWFLLFILLSMSMMMSAQYSPKLDNNEYYELLIVAKKWEYNIFDLKQLDSNVTQVLYSENYTNLEVNIREIQVEPSTSALIHFVSSDVQHGLKIEELDFELIANRPTPEEEFGKPTNGTIKFPSTNEVYETEAHIFAGLETEEMVIRFIVGDPITNFSLPTPFNIFIIILFTLPILLKSKFKN